MDGLPAVGWLAFNGHGPDAVGIAALPDTWAHRRMRDLEVVVRDQTRYIRLLEDRVRPGLVRRGVAEVAAQESLL